MAKNKKYRIIEPIQTLLEEKKSLYGLRTYVSLFSSAGIGCYGFKEENFHCIATVELLERRLKIQQFNNKCVYPSGYICGDMTASETKDRVFDQLDMWKRVYNIDGLDVLQCLFDNLYMLLEVRMRYVHHMHKDVRLTNLVQCTLESLDQLMRKLPDESHGVAQKEWYIFYYDLAHSCVESSEQFVFRKNVTFSQ